MSVLGKSSDPVSSPAQHLTGCATLSPRSEETNGHIVRCGSLGARDRNRSCAWCLGIICAQRVSVPLYRDGARPQVADGVLFQVLKLFEAVT